MNITDCILLQTVDNCNAIDTENHVLSALLYVCNIYLVSFFIFSSPPNTSILIMVALFGSPTDCSGRT